MARLLIAALCLTASAAPALAHASGRGFVMLLPTGYVTLGGALAVLLSFLVISLLPRAKASPHRPAEEADVASRSVMVSSLASAVLIGLIIVAGVLQYTGWAPGS